MIWSSRAVKGGGASSLRCWQKLRTVVVMMVGAGGWRGKVVLVVLMVTVTLLAALGAWNGGLRHVFFADICEEEATLRSSWQPENKHQKEEWWRILCRMEQDMRQIQYSCRDSRWMGNRKVCFDFSLVPARNCTVYSFGIDYNFKFDDAMGDYGCAVFSFDPSMNVEDHRRSDKVTFKRLGLYSKDTDAFQPRLDGYVTSATKWRMRRLSSIMKDLGHSQGSLTLLKIDIESTEWEVVKDLLSEESLLASIPQVLIEWHLFKDAPPRSLYADLMDVYFSFKARGFHSFYWGSEGEDHRSMDSLFSQTETSWVNERFLVSRGS